MALPNFTEIFRANILLWFSVVVVPLFLYSLLRSIYNLYFHALSPYPGPKLAAISNIWYAHQPPKDLQAHRKMAVEDRRSVETLWWVIQMPAKLLFVDPLVDYSCIGDVVRIAPNELVFLTPQAGNDFEDLGEDGGISFEIDPIKHRDVARKLSPAFSARNTNAKEAVLHKHIDSFVEKMIAMGGEKDIELRQWTDWLTMDVSADMTYNRQMNQMRDGYFYQLIPRDTPAPSNQKQINHLEQIAGQLLVAGWEPISNQIYSSIFFLLKEPNAYKSLLHEIRRTFKNYNEITPDAIANMKYLHACLQETDGLPRMSPGAIVDGNYIPRGVICQISHFAAARNPRYFTDALSYRPQRWLASKQPEYDCKYENDDPKAFLPFNQGPRMCPASAIAWTQMNLYLAKILWTFDVEAVSGQDVSFDRDFSVYAMRHKPQFWVRFVPVKREDGR
ncbi:hypothetical protein BOTNAR_0073g00160 [Botryotinia narcissicola]|uniref:Cytochrome P450 n=1 Tax=Botryotinia narcissicola TaxID=278944 RepID=A0A4Z1IWY9_9HELO|nr:hypothetical protein BOTNAR_0073g00160 [Botryotinia narcissicola]